MTSLSPSDIPPSTSLWKQEKYPGVNKSIFESYCEHKRQGIAGQQQKAHRLFLSRKVVTVKVLQENNVTFVKGIIKKSYGQIFRPAVLKFTSSGIPEKGHCTCPIGLSGLCCHILCLLHFLIHLTETGEKFVALTATQQLQKWQGKGSIPMLPVHKLVKVPSARLKKVKKGMKPSYGLKTGTDIEKPTLKRYIEAQMQKCDKKFKEIGFTR